MDLATRLVEQGARVFASIAAGRSPPLPDAFTAGLIVDALRERANLPEPDNTIVIKPRRGRPPKATNGVSAARTANYGERKNITRVYELLRNHQGEGMRPNEIAKALGMPTGSVGFYMHQGISEKQLKRDKGVYTWSGGEGGGEPSRGGTSQGRETRAKLIELLKKFSTEGAGANELNKASHLSLSQIHKQLKAMIFAKEVRHVGTKYIWVPESEREQMPTPPVPVASPKEKHVEKVLEAMGQAPDKVYTSQQLMKFSGYKSDGGGFTAMRGRMVGDGLIEKVGAGRYKLVPKGN